MIFRNLAFDFDDCLVKNVFCNDIYIPQPQCKHKDIQYTWQVLLLKSFRKASISFLSYSYYKALHDSFSEWDGTVCLVKISYNWFTLIPLQSSLSLMSSCINGGHNLFDLLRPSRVRRKTRMPSTIYWFPNQTRSIRWYLIQRFFRRSGSQKIFTRNWKHSLISENWSNKFSVLTLKIWLFNPVTKILVTESY